MCGLLLINNVNLFYQNSDALSLDARLFTGKDSEVFGIAVASARINKLEIENNQYVYDGNETA